jgi:enoyl-CoA hydratase/carnithine racemase
MTYEHLSIEESGRVVSVRLNRPQARNALDEALMRELLDVAQALRARTDIAAVLLCGDAGFFSAGMDLRAMQDALAATPRTLLELRQWVQLGPDMCAAWERIEAVTIAAIEGYCIGGAVALAAACDFRICGAGASMRLPEVPLGMNMSWHSLPRLTSLIGPARAKRLTIFGEAVDAPTLLGWGLADEVVEAGQAVAAARRWAAQLEALPPLPLRMSKEAINAAAGALHHATTFMDRDQFLLALGSDDLREGVDAFLARRTPRFTGN